MSELDETTRSRGAARADATARAGDAARAPGARPSSATLLGCVALLLAPVAGSAGGALELLTLGGIDPASDPAAFLGAVTAAPGLWSGMGAAMLVMALLTMLWAPAVWRLAHGSSPRWAWAAAVGGALFAFGQAVHLVSWIVLSQALAAALEPDAALGVIAAIESNGLFTVIFAPYLLGALLAAPLAAIALWRARLLPVWSIPVIAVASIGMLLIGTGSPVILIAYPALWIAAFAPALARLLRRRER
ncbi:hypothetical protein SAMN04487783_2079 [Agrococcus baldri]|uniref:Uncharacterized protein n=1 Tax=Agrococcus baldri TaxID=153730 RepID=A0AA94HNH4_9MICO|nr:hypothetical protein [Agrococcus baldri]SFS15594.1 hypothetical protein SAMN04487783_2079 [Agrococcus baldri]